MNSLLPTYNAPSFGAPIQTGSPLVVELILRELELSGPLSGLEILNRTARPASLVSALPPNYALLHDLADAGLLVKEDALPPRYRITLAGRRERQRLLARSL